MIILIVPQLKLDVYVRAESIARRFDKWILAYTGFTRSGLVARVRGFFSRAPANGRVDFYRQILIFKRWGHCN
jgi:hypothetical protein